MNIYAVGSLIQLTELSWRQQWIYIPDAGDRAVPKKQAKIDIQSVLNSLFDPQNRRFFDNKMDAVNYAKSLSMPRDAYVSPHAFSPAIFEVEGIGRDIINILSAEIYMDHQILYFGDLFGENNERSFRLEPDYRWDLKALFLNGQEEKMSSFISRTRLEIPKIHLTDEELKDLAEVIEADKLLLQKELQRGKQHKKCFDAPENVGFLAQDEMDRLESNPFGMLKKPLILSRTKKDSDVLAAEKLQAEQHKKGLELLTKIDPLPQKRVIDFM